MFLSSSGDKFTLLKQNSVTDVAAHLDEHQHGVSIQISINLEKTFLRISSIRKFAVTWIVARVFAYLPSFYFQILDLIYWTVVICYFDLFWIAWHWKPINRGLSPAGYTRKLFFINFLCLLCKETFCKKAVYSGSELICEFAEQCLIITKTCFW